MKNEPTYEPIVDQFGRVHDYLRISLTERCNLRCFYCMPEEGVELRPKAEFMSSEEVIEFAEQFVALGVKKIRITGGEPLIKKDIRNILLGLSKLPVELSITTNAVIVDKHIDTLKEAGIKTINVSLDSLEEDKFNRISRRNFYTRIRSNIDLLVEEGFHVKLNAVLMRGENEHEVIDFIELGRAVNMDIRFIEFMPFDGNNWNWEKKVSQEEILEQVETHYGATEITSLDDEPNATARNFRVTGFKGTFGIISSMTNPFCDTCNRIRLTADGKIKNCLFSSDETDLLTMYRAGGNIEPLIRMSIQGKKKARAGITSFEDANSDISGHRSMVTIGG